MPIRVYKYGLLPPTTHRDRIIDQMRLGRRYQNNLVELERKRRTEEVDLLTGHPLTKPLTEDLAKATAAVDAAYEAIRAKRKEARGRAETVADVEALKDLKKTRSECQKALWQEVAKLKLESEIQEKIAAVRERTNFEKRRLRAASGLYWGTYLLVERAMDLAKKSPDEPNFHHFTGEGYVGVQLQQGLEVEKIFGDDRRVRVDPPTDGRKKPRTVLHLRIGSEGRDPVFADFTMILHRPLPPGGRVSWVQVNRRLIGRREEWTVCFTVELDEAALTGHGTGAVAVDLGWRRMGENALRGGWALGDDGRSQEIHVPADLESGLAKADSLRGIRDKNLDQLRPLLSAWLAEASGVPDWFKEATETLYAWRSAARFAKLARVWRGQRWPGDEVGYEMLETWRYQDQHLWDWEVNQRHNTLAARKNTYRTLGAELARCYETLVLEDFNLQAMGEKAAPGERDVKVHRVQKRAAATSELREAIEQAFLSRGGKVVKVPAPNTTRACAACGSLEIWDQEKEVVHTCGACGEKWDQDENACRNLLILFREGLGASKENAKKKNRFANKGKAKS